MNLDDYDLHELVELRQRIDTEIRVRHAQNPEQTENQLRDAARKWGLALSQMLTGVSSEQERRASRVCYRHPYDTNLAWGGMGAKPGWVRDWEADGNSLESLRTRR